MVSRGKPVVSAPRARQASTGFVDTALQQNSPKGDSGLPGTPKRPRLIALTRDPALMEALDYAEADGRLAFVSDEDKLASLLMSGDAGIVVIDAGACNSPVADLAERLHAQLPDVVLVAAGRSSDQSELATQVATGTVYRFLHKPISNQRVKLFVDAAWRRFEDGATGTHNTVPEAVPAGQVPLLPVLAGVGIIAVVAVGTWLAVRPAHAPTPAAQGRISAASSTAVVDAAGSNSAPNPAPAASAPPNPASGIARPESSTASPGTGSAATALNSAPVNPAAAANARIDRLATDAAQALLAGKLDEAVRLAQQARDIDPASDRIRLLQEQIQHEQQQRAAQAALAAQAAQSLEAAQAARAEADRALAGQAAAQAQAAEQSAAAAQARAAAQQAQRAAAQARQQKQQAAAAQPSQQDAQARAPQSAAAAVAASTPAAVPPAPTGSAIASAGERPAQAPQSERHAGPVVAGNSPVLGYDNGQSGLHDPEKIVPESLLERITTVEPEYPPAARSAAGVVDLEFTVRPDGSVGDVTVTHAEPAGVFDQAAVEAVRQWRYRPVEREGAAVSQRARLRLSFSPD